MKNYLVNLVKTPVGIFSAVAVAAVMLISVWFLVRSDSGPVDLVEVKLGSVTQTVSVTGKVRAVQSVDLAFEKSGRIANVYADTGKKVRTGQLILQLDGTDARSAVRDAQTNLESAKLALDKLRGTSLGDNTDQQIKNYTSGFNVLNSAYTDSSVILDALNNLLFSSTVDTSTNKKSNIQYYADMAGGSNSNFRDLPAQMKDAYDMAVRLYNQAFADYKLIRGSTDGPAIITALTSTYNAEVKISDIIKTVSGIIRYITDTATQKNASLFNLPIITQNQNDLIKYGATIGNNITDLSNASQTIANYGLDVRSQEIVVQQKQNALTNAQDNLSKYSMYAPFDGVVTRVDAKVGEIVGSNVSLVSLISQSALEIVANVPEADVAKIKVGNVAKATLDAFNAYSSATEFTATVSAIDPAEVVIDGVPTYKIALQFKNLDAGVKPGMTANLDITTDIHENVLVIEQRAVVRQGDKQIVQLPGATSDAPVKTQTVVTGLRSADGTIEILSGLKAGDKVLARPIIAP